MSSRVGARSAWSTCRTALVPRPLPSSSSSLSSQPCTFARSLATARSGASVRHSPAATTARTPRGVVICSTSGNTSTGRRQYATDRGGGGGVGGGYGLDGEAPGPAGPKRGRRETRSELEADIDGFLAEDAELDLGLEDDELEYEPGVAEELAKGMAEGEEDDATESGTFMDDFDFGSLYANGATDDANGADPGDVAIPEGGLTLEQQDMLFETGVIPPPVTGDKVTDDLESLAAGEPVSMEPRPVHTPAVGYKFDLPSLPLPAGSNLKHRYHPVLHQFTNLLMRHGKLSAAQRHVAYMLNFLRTSPPPNFSPKYPLLPGHPPATHLPLNPVLYLTLAVDSVAPLIKIKRLKGMAGGGNALEIPTPLPVRMRRRLAFSWILEAVAKKPSRGSGKRQFAARLASEVISVIEGSSGVWDKRDQIHKAGTAARANLFLPQYRKSIR